MKLAIVTAVHGRPKITEAFTKSIKRIYLCFLAFISLVVCILFTKFKDKYPDENE